jgi:hypothetical protein
VRGIGVDFLTVYQRPGRRSSEVYFLSVYCYLQRRYLLGIFSENSLIPDLIWRGIFSESALVPEQESSGVEYFLTVHWYLRRRVCTVT